QVRFLWLDPALNVLDPLWNDTPPWDVATGDFNDTAALHTSAYKAPTGASYLRVEVHNLGDTVLRVRGPEVWQDGVYIEQFPNGTQGAIAFSFDWESAMGGA